MLAIVVLQGVLWTALQPQYASRIHSFALMQAHVIFFVLALACATMQHVAEGFVFHGGMNMRFADRALNLFFVTLTLSIACGAQAIAPLPTWCLALLWATPVVTLLVRPGISFAFERDFNRPSMGVWGTFLGAAMFIFAYQLAGLFGLWFGVCYVALGLATVAFNVAMAITEKQVLHMIDTVCHLAWVSAVAAAILLQAG